MDSTVDTDASASDATTSTAALPSMALTRRHEAGFALVAATMPLPRFPLLQVYILHIYALVLQLASQFV